MSMNSSPNRSSPDSYDSYYDPSYTAEITSKMHVPDKICVIEGIAPPEAFASHPVDVKSRMNVPERIIVAGDNKHIAVRESIPELKFEPNFSLQFSNHRILTSPPDVLTVDEYPPEEFKPQAIETKKKSVLDQVLNETADLNESSLGSNAASPAEEMAVLRRQCRHLSRRILTLEQETQQIRQRELIFCVLGVTYIFIKGLAWIHRHL